MFAAQAKTLDEIEYKKAKFLQLVKNNSFSSARFMLSRESSETLKELAVGIFSFRDSNQKSALDYAAENNNVDFFYFLLETLYHCNGQEINTVLKEISKNSKINPTHTTPWHIAAARGYADFFKPPIGNSLYSLIWGELEKVWLNAGDKKGNRPLHLALIYTPNDVSDKKFNRIKGKKQVIKALVELDKLDLAETNSRLQTPLIAASELACYETIKVLLRIHKKNKSKKKKNNSILALSKSEIIPSENIVPDKKIKDNAKEKKKDKEEKKEKDDSSLTAFKRSKKIHLTMVDKEGYDAQSYARANGNQNIYLQLVSARKPKLAKQPVDDKVVTYDDLADWAKNINFSEENFLKHLKLATHLEYHEVCELIDLRINETRKQYKKKTLLSVIFGSLCPAITAAVTIGTFGGVNPEPFTAAIITAIAFPVILVPFTYVCYKMRMREYSETAKEAMRLNWLATKLPIYELDFENELSAIDTALKELKNKLDREDASKGSFNTNLRSEYDRLIDRQKEINSKMEKLIEFTPDGRAKLGLSYIPRAELKRKKSLALFDPKENSAWVNRQENFAAFIAYNTDIFCPLGAGLNIASVIATLVAAKFGAALIGGGAAGGSVFGPIGTLVGAAVGTLALGLVIAAAIYKSSFDVERRNMGTQNRRLVESYEICKSRSDFTNLQTQRRANESQLSILENLFSSLEASRAFVGAKRLINSIKAKVTQSAAKPKTVTGKATAKYKIEQLEVETKTKDKCSLFGWFSWFTKPQKKTPEFISSNQLETGFRRNNH